MSLLHLLLVGVLGAWWFLCSVAWWRCISVVLCLVVFVFGGCGCLGYSVVVFVFVDRVRCLQSYCIGLFFRIVLGLCCLILVSVCQIGLLSRWASLIWWRNGFRLGRGYGEGQWDGWGG